MRIYLAGGAVRDLLLGRAATDKDYLVTEAEPDEFMKAFPNAQRVGKAFPVFILDGSEYVFPRGSTLQEDLHLRDLTINAMLLGPDGELICHENALDDLKNRVFRPASRQSLKNDPLRIIRAARFSTTFPSFTALPELVEAMRQAGSQKDFDEIPQDRIAREVIKSLNAERPGNFLRLLSRSECLTPWFKELTEAHAIPAGPSKYHDASVLEHTSRIMDLCAGNELTVWMALCHDLGKTLTPHDQWPHHRGHDRIGGKLAQILGERVKMPNRFIPAGRIGAELHMIAGRYDELRPGTRVDLLMKAHVGRCFRELFQLVQADTGKDYLPQALEERQQILDVHLPLECQNLKEKSGRILREMRAQKLAQRL